MTQLRDIGRKPVEANAEKIAGVLNKEAIPLIREIRRRVQGYEANFGDGVAVAFSFEHGLGTLTPAVVVVDLSDNHLLLASEFVSIVATDQNTLDITLTAPVTGTVRISA